MATRLTEGTDLNHLNNPVKIKLHFCFLTEMFNSIFKMLVVLLYLPYLAIIRAFTVRRNIMCIHILVIIIIIMCIKLKGASHDTPETTVPTPHDILLKMLDHSLSKGRWL
jgi:hypothetical protein